MQFIEKILLLQCLKKETATAKELDLRPLGKVIIFRDRQTDRQNLPIIYRYRILHHRDHHKAAVSVGASPDLISWLDGWLPRWKRGRWG